MQALAFQKNVPGKPSSARPGERIKGSAPLLRRKRPDGVPLLFRGLAFAALGSVLPWMFLAWCVL